MGNKLLTYKDITFYPEYSQSLAINEWFTEGGYHQLVINSVKTCGSDQTFQEDLLAYTVEYFLSMPIERQVKIYNDESIEEYVTRLMGISLKSSTSPFYSKYRKFLISTREITDWTPFGIEEEYQEETSDCKACDCIKQKIQDHSDWYEKKLLEMAILLEMKPGSIADELGLDSKSVTSNISVAKKKIAKLCKHLLTTHNSKRKKKNARV